MLSAVAVHRQEGQCIGEFGSGFSNANYWWVQKAVWEVSRGACCCCGMHYSLCPAILVTAMLCCRSTFLFSTAWLSLLVVMTILVLLMCGAVIERVLVTRGFELRGPLCHALLGCEQGMHQTPKRCSRSDVEHETGLREARLCQRYLQLHFKSDTGVLRGRIVAGRE